MQINSAKLGFGRAFEVCLEDLNEKQKKITEKNRPSGPSYVVTNSYLRSNLRIIPKDDTPLSEDFKYGLQLVNAGIPAKYTTMDVSDRDVREDDFSDGFVWVN